MRLALSLLFLPLVATLGCRGPSSPGDDAGFDAGADGADGAHEGDRVVDGGDLAPDAGDPGEGVAPRIISVPPIAAAEEVPFRYELACVDDDGDELALGIGGLDSCGGALADGGNGLATYAFTPSDGQGGGSCTLEVTCSDDRFVVTQNAVIEISEIGVTEAGRFVRFSPIAYPGLAARSVVVYLPPGYDQGQDRYPVLYLHDGQNLFDPAEAAFGVEWEVDETADSLTAEGVMDPHLVVGIHNTPDRIADYTPDVDPAYGGGNGDAYADFVVRLLKPIVDARFRTRPEPEHTTLMGSSLGGIISLHIHQRYPGVFGGIGAVSPSLWWNNQSPVRAFETYSGPQPRRLWLDMGTAEGGDAFGLMPEPIAALRELRGLALGRDLLPGESLGYLEDPGAGHDEAAWAGRLESILWFLLSSTRPVDMTPSGIRLLLFHPNLDLPGPVPATSVSVELTREDRVRSTLINQDVDLSSLDDQVATIDPDGTVTARGAGTATIRAAVHGFEATGQVTVTADPQTRVTFVVAVPPAPDTPPGDTVYITGSDPQLGPWDPGLAAMSPDAQDSWTVTLVLPAGAELEYKYTRGSWLTVEKGAGGEEIPNRRITPVGADMTVNDTVAGWAQ